MARMLVVAFPMVLVPCIAGCHLVTSLVKVLYFCGATPDMQSAIFIVDEPKPAQEAAYPSATIEKARCTSKQDHLEGLDDQ